MTLLTAAASFALAAAGVGAAIDAKSAPYAWAYLSSAVWAIWLVSKGWSSMHFWDRTHLLWGATSIFALCKFTQGTITAGDPFEGWSDIYFFCGSDYRYCRCDFTWNLLGWLKALVLWSFVVTASLGVQKLVIHAGLHGLLPGEEVVTKESLVSFCWRLIPYWLNSWEQQWGAECSSVMFELPHFAMELLVVLPCVQIMSSRLKILLMPPGRGLVPPFDQTPPEEAANMSPVIMTGVWEDRKADHDLHGRLRANFRVLTLVVGISGLAAFNALYVPLHLEGVIHTHPRSSDLLEAANAGDWLTSHNSTSASDAQALPPQMAAAVESYMAKGCSSQDKLLSALAKHAQEITRMQNPQYQDLTRCVEAALTIMRLSCEQYFTLISVFAAYLFFRQRLPAIAQEVIWVTHRVSNIFKKAILYSFPAICWLYGAGLMFSSFASLVFWGQPAARLWEKLRARFTTVLPVGLQDANQAQIEQMNGNCAVCWSPMTISNDDSSLSAPSSPEEALSQTSEEEEDQSQLFQQGLPQGFMELPFNVQATSTADPLAAAEEEEDESALERHPCKALPCGHAFHDSCIAKWLAQCHVQSRQPTCPMCNLVIKLQVSYQFSLLSRSPPQQQGVMQQPEQQQGALPQPAGQQQVVMLPEVAQGPLQHQHAGQQASDTSNGHTSLGQGQSHSHSPSSSSHAQSIGEWHHHAHGMTETRSHQQRPAHQHRSTDRQQHSDQDAAGPFAHASSSWRSGNENIFREHQHAQQRGQAYQSGSMRPSTLWGFAANGVNLQQAPATSEQGPFGHGPTEAEHNSARADSASSVRSALPASSQFQQQPQSGLLRDDSVQGDISSSVPQQAEPQAAVQEEEQQWVCVDQTGRAQLGRRWSPASFMRRMMVRTRRHHDNQGHPGNGRVAARTDLADATAVARSN